jgi:hypothetical protein
MKSPVSGSEHFSHLCTVVVSECVSGIDSVGIGISVGSWCIDVDSMVMSRHSGMLR